MKRVVITGMGIVSSLGNNVSEVEQSLRDGKSGITFQPEYESHGLRSQVAGSININVEELIDRKLLRFMAKGHAYAWIAMQEAISDAKLSEDQVSNIRTGIIVGAGGTSTESMLQGSEILKEKGIRRVGPYMVTKTMSNGVSACLATGAKIKGVNYAIPSACSTSAHCIGNAYELIQMGKQDIIFAGGAEEEHWTMSYLVDAMGTMSSKYNAEPEKASRTFDVDRDGFVISGGGSILVLEEYEHAKARGAKIYADAIRVVFGENEYGKIPAIASTKSLSGHALGAAGSNEAIYSLIMMDKGFLTPSLNIDQIDPAGQGLPILVEKKQEKIQTAMSNSFGFGGVNATLIFSTKNL